MSDREKILQSVREALAPLPTRAEYPTWSDELAHFAAPGVSDFDRFRQQFAKAHGRLVLSWTELGDLLRGLGATAGYIDPVLLDEAGDSLAGLRLATNFERTRIDEYSFGITRASGAIAETGTLIMTDASTSYRLAALAPWVHVAVVDMASLQPSVTAAIAAFDSDPSIIFATGPSKTADIEGILIEGVHGPGIQVCLIR